MEIQNLGIIKSDKSLSESIIKEKRFLDDDGKFSRIKYEKFLIENNVTAGEFERKLGKEVCKKNYLIILAEVLKVRILSQNLYF